MKVLGGNVLFVLVLIAYFHPGDADDHKSLFKVNSTIEQVHSHDFIWSREGEFLIDTNVTYAGAPFGQGYPSVAFDGTDHFVVWQDDRNGNNDIYGARVSQNGIVLDHTGIVICGSIGEQRYPSVAFDGTNYLVAWADNRNGNWDIFGARVAPTGLVLDTASIQIFATTATQDEPAVAFGDSNYLVVWEDNQGYNIYGTRITPDGIVLDTAGIPISTATNYQSSPALIFGDTNFLVVWTDERNGAADIYGTRVEPSGAVVDTAGIAISAAVNVQRRPAVSYDNANFLAVWEDRRNGSEYDIYGARVDQSGIVLDSAGIPISMYYDDQVSPSLSFCGTNYLVTWEDYRNDSWAFSDIYSSRVSTDGSVLDPNGFVICDSTLDEYRPWVSSGDSIYFVAWHQGSGNGTGDIVGVRMDTANSILDTAVVLISTAVNDQRAPAVEYDGNNYLVVWCDSREGSSYTDIYGSRIDSSGAILDTSCVPICSTSRSQENPSLSFDSTNYLVVWQDHRSGTVSPTVYGVRVSQNGAVLGSSFAVSSYANNWHGFPSVCFGNTVYFTSWWDNRNGYYHDDIYGARVSTEGFTLDTTGIAVCTAPDSQFFSTVSYDGTNFLVVWDDWRNHNWDIFGSRVNESGVVLDPNGFIVSTASLQQRTPAIVFNGVNYFVVWSDHRNSSWDIYGTRLSQNGVILDPDGIAVSTAPGEQTNPSVAFDGINHFVVWQDSRNGSWDIYGAKIDTSGTTVDSFEVSTQLGDQVEPDIVNGSDNQVLLVYSGWTDTINGNFVDTKRIWGKFYPAVGKEEENKFVARDIGLNLNVYPNPVYKECVVEYNVPVKSRIDISVYDVAGRLVSQLINETQNSGIYREKIDMTSLPQGIYFVKLYASNQMETRKIILLK